MPRGDNPNSRANLRAFTKGTEKEQRKIQKAGGEASGKARRALKTFKELDDEYTTDDERMKMLDMLKKRAMQGNLKAYELYRDSMGMRPTEKIEQTNRDVVLNFGDIARGDADGDKS